MDWRSFMKLLNHNPFSQMPIAPHGQKKWTTKSTDHSRKMGWTDSTEMTTSEWGLSTRLPRDYMSGSGAANHRLQIQTATVRDSQHSGSDIYIIISGERRDDDSYDWDKSGVGTRIGLL